MVHMPTSDDVIALQQALSEALQRNESLAGELRVTRAERDLLEEKLSKFTRQLFAASSEATALQKDMFFNEAESLGAQAEPAIEESSDGDDSDKIDVPGHKRAKRGRKPLDPALPRNVTRTPTSRTCWIACRCTPPAASTSCCRIAGRRADACSSLDDSHPRCQGRRSASLYGLQSSRCVRRTPTVGRIDSAELLPGALRAIF